MAVLAGVNATSVTTPTGVFSSTECGRAQQIADADADVAVASGRDVVSSTYTLASGADTG